jgi:hypothetical protein
MTENRVGKRKTWFLNEQQAFSVSRRMRTRLVLAVVVVVVAVAAGGCLSVPSPSIRPLEMSSGRTVLLVGDSLMGGAAAQLSQVLEDSHVGGISVVDAHQNGSGLATPIAGMSPAEYVAAQFEARPDVDVVAMEWAGACAKPCPDYGSSAFYARWGRNAAEVREVVRDHGARLIDVRPPPPPPGSSAPESEYMFTDTVSSVLAYFAGPTPGATLADWWEAFSGLDGAYYSTLFYDGAWHTVRAGDKIHFSTDGQIRAATVLAAAIESALGTK